MKLADNIEKLIRVSRVLDVNARPEMDSRILSDILELQKTKIPTPAIWRTIIKSKLTKLTAAAVIIIGIMIGINYFGGSIDGATVAWGEVLKKVQGINTVAYRLIQSERTVFSPDIQKKYGGKKEHGFEVEQRFRYSAQHGYRCDAIHEGKVVMRTYALLNNNTRYTLMDQVKIVRKSVVDPESITGVDPRIMVERIISKGLKRSDLGNDVIDGKKVQGIEVYDYMWARADSSTARIWVDVVTKLPVKIEFEGKGVPIKGRQQHFKHVLDNFQWDIDVSASEFEPDIPPDYKLVDVPKPKAIPQPTEENALEALRRFADVVDGKYPSSMKMVIVLQEFFDARKKPLSEPPRDHFSDEAMQRQKEKYDQINSLIPICQFYVQLLKDGCQPKYFGDKVTSQEKDKMLMRWKLSDSQYRVIYGDLRVENVSSKRLTELEAALPK